MAEAPWRQHVAASGHHARRAEPARPIGRKRRADWAGPLATRSAVLPQPGPRTRNCRCLLKTSRQRPCDNSANARCRLRCTLTVALALPTSTRHRLQGAGHVPHLTHPDRYVETVRQFCHTAPAHTPVGQPVPVAAPSRSREVRWRTNHSRATRVTSSSAPGSSNRCVARDNGPDHITALRGGDQCRATPGAGVMPDSTLAARHLRDISEFRAAVVRADSARVVAAQRSRMVGR